MTPHPDHPEIEFARDVVVESGAIALQYFRTPMDVQNKIQGYYDPVTEADKNVEHLIRRRIGERYPGHRIVGEEHGTTGAGDTWWIIDPIDGTRAFISGMPNWGILLGYVEDKQPVVGAMHQPFTGETYLGGPSGAWLERGAQRSTIRVRESAELADAVLYSTHPTMFTPDQLARYQALARQVRLQRWGGDCYAFCMLALGCVDLVVEGMLMPYDIVPLIPIIEGAGGVVTDLQGRTPMQGGVVVAAANRKLHEAALAAMNPK